MTSQEAITQPRTASILGQAIGPEFAYNYERLRQPDSTVLIKLGGVVVARWLGVMADAVQTLVELGIYPAIVHGAGPQIDAGLKAQGIAEKKIDGKRVTDKATLAVVIETLETVNSAIVENLESRGVDAQPLTEGIFTADFLDKKTYGFVGDTPVVNATPVTEALTARSVPVISCLGSHEEGQRLNLNGDTASAALAERLRAHKFVTLSDVGGVLDQRRNIIPVLNIRSGDIDKLIADGTISDGMIPKIREITNSVEALPDDASAVITMPASLIRELFTHAGEGTLIRKGDEIVHYASIGAVSHQRMRELIESSLDGKLQRDYFTSLPESAEVFATAQAYNGAAIVIPEIPDDGEVLPAYLDKLVVRPGYQGLGIGRELLDAVISRYKGGVYWRTRTDSGPVEWYSKIADSYKVANGWTVFGVGVPASRQKACIERAIHTERSVFYKIENGVLPTERL